MAYQVTDAEYYSIVRWAAQRELDRKPHYRDTFPGVAENLILDGTFSTRAVLCYTDNLWASEEADEEDVELAWLFGPTRDGAITPLETIAILALSADLEAATEAIGADEPWPMGSITRARGV